MSGLEVKTLVEDALNEGRLFTVRFKTPSLPAAGTYLVGVTTGSRPVEFMDRTYVATMNSAEIELFENAYTGGTPILGKNRNFTYAGNGPVAYSAAPSATIVGNPEASVSLQAGSGTGSSAIGLLTEGERYILKPNTQYVLRETNTDSGAGVISTRFTYREVEVG